jgi:hypothetical protein
MEIAGVAMNTAPIAENESLDDATAELIRRIVLAVQAGRNGDLALEQKIIQNTEQQFAPLWHARACSATRH